MPPDSWRSMDCGAAMSSYFSARTTSISIPHGSDAFGSAPCRAFWQNRRCGSTSKYTGPACENCCSASMPGESLLIRELKSSRN